MIMINGILSLLDHAHKPFLNMKEKAKKEMHQHSIDQDYSILLLDYFMFEMNGVYTFTTVHVLTYGRCLRKWAT